MVTDELAAEAIVKREVVLPVGIHEVINSGIVREPVVTISVENKVF